MRRKYYLSVLELLAVEVHVAEMEDGGDDLEDDLLLFSCEPQHLAYVSS